jgi:hypothetical protein
LPDPDAKPRRRGGKPATNRFSYGAVKYHAEHEIGLCKHSCVKTRTEDEETVAYCRGLQTFPNEQPEILDFVWFTDEALFHLSGYVNPQNTLVWAAENPHVYHEELLHPLKVGVWCLISRWRIIGPIFVEETVNTQVYMNIFNRFVNQLDDEELQHGFFQQDGAICRTSSDIIA